MKALIIIRNFSIEYIIYNTVDKALNKKKKREKSLKTGNIYLVV